LCLRQSVRRSQRFSDGQRRRRHVGKARIPTATTTSTRSKPMACWPTSLQTVSTRTALGNKIEMESTWKRTINSAKDKVRSRENIWKATRGTYRGISGLGPRTRNSSSRGGAVAEFPPRRKSRGGQACLGVGAGRLARRRGPIMTLDADLLKE
jgi:hypothetical protein